MNSTSTAPDFANFPVRRRGSYLEKFEVGQEYEHHWGRTLDIGDSTLFSTSLAYFLPLYLNEEFAQHEGHPSRPINPFLVLCTVVGVSVEDLSESAGPFLGIEECEFLAPVYAGDTLRAHSVVLETRVSASRPGRGIVTWRTTGYNQRDEVVVTYVRKNLLATLEEL
ncbi:MaoC family dehydratase [Microbacterium sp. A93]|uniref:MaoC family dehydratase n=1 Tax=Microbacterium sp. A93 TaxID=3450716 RepID=UPI003F42C509